MKLNPKHFYFAKLDIIYPNRVFIKCKRREIQ